MIPYIKIPDLPIGPLKLHPFGILVATGVLLGTHLATKRAKQLGYDTAKLNSFITWMLVSGFINSHVLDSLFYHWDEVKRRPQSLLYIWEGLSSFGGFIGALLGIIAWKYLDYVGFDRGIVKLRKQPLPILPFADLILAVFPVAWIFGRSGCSVVHDHPGAIASADSWLAVAYPTARPHATEEAMALVKTTKIGFISLLHGDFPRYDLGFLELLFTIALAAAFAATWKRKLPVGSYILGASLAYAPVRFAMDFLRIPAADGGDTRLGGLTPAQWSCIGLLVGGTMVWFFAKRVRAAKSEEEWVGPLREPVEENKSVAS